MFKNQLQELAQRSCFNLPCYGCTREGPDHAPRFKACVNFNGEIFESPSYCTTLRQAEHAAAEVALNVLSSRGPSKSLTARVLDETGIYKNLLQETAHRAGLKLPVYTTVRSGPGHAPIFTCTVELAGMSFNGEPAKTKKQAEKNAAIAAWCALKNFPEMGSLASKESSSRPEEQDQAAVAKLLSNFRPKDQNQNQNQQARKRMVRGHRDLSFGHQKWKILDLLSVQKPTSFVSLLPPPPPPTASKILPLTNPPNRPEIALRHALDELENETSSSSIYMPFPLRDKTQMANSVVRSANQNPFPIPSSELEKETSCSSVYMPFPLRDKTQMANSVIRSASQNPAPVPSLELEKETSSSSSSSSSYMPFSPRAKTQMANSVVRSTNQKPSPIPPPEISVRHALEELEKETSSSSSSSSFYMPCPLRDRTQMGNRLIRSTSQNPSPNPPQGFNFNFNYKMNPQRRNVPAVQIRSVIPVCAAPNPSAKLKEISASAPPIVVPNPSPILKEISASALIATEVPISNKPLLQQEQSSPPQSELSSCDEFNTKLQL